MNQPATSDKNHDAALGLMQAVAAEVDADLAQRLTAAKVPANLREAVKYSVLNGGKRLRPVLTLLSCDAVGGNRADVMPAAAAIELIHCFSLVHDDLPAMDDDDLRRGRPTLHIHAGEAMAILAGDVMVSLAFEFISQAAADHERRIRLVAELAQATTAMIAGQVYDTLGGFPERLSSGAKDAGATAHNTALERLHLIHRNKTGALLRAACRMGAIGGGASADQLEAITRYGEAMGLMFQIVDDLLDVTQSTEHIGKTTGKDVSAGKLTFPGLLGVEESRTEVERLRDSAKHAITVLGNSARPLRALCDLMAVRTK